MSRTDEESRNYDRFHKDDQCDNSPEPYGKGRSNNSYDCREYSDNFTPPAPYGEGLPHNHRDAARDLRGRGDELGARRNSDNSASKRKFESPISAVRRLIKERVLYMMIVTVPTEEEMADAKKLLEQTKGM